MLITKHSCADDTRLIDNDKFLECPVCKIPLEPWFGEVIEFESHTGDDYGDDE